MIRTAVLLAASLVFITSTSAQTADKPKETPVALERMLHGEWKGPACGGDWTFGADGNFEVQHYSPGGNQLAGTWEVRCNALPPTLVRTCKTSDDPGFVGKTWEVKLIQLDDEALAYQYPDQHPGGHTVRYTRVKAPVARERMLHGAWQGGDCVGELILAADGTFERQHYSPGNNKLTGTWKVRWNALPPTLVLNCTASDDPEYVRQEEVKLVQLDDESLAFGYPGERTVRYTRADKSEERELDALQGTWVPLQYEVGGKKVEGGSTRHIIKGDKVTVQVNGETIAEGKVTLDPTKNPKHLDFQFTSGRTDFVSPHHSIIYVRAGDHVIYCGNRDGKTRPSEFVSGTAKGGEYLLAWKIER